MLILIGMASAPEPNRNRDKVEIEEILTAKHVKYQTEQGHHIIHNKGHGQSVHRRVPTGPPTAAQLAEALRDEIESDEIPTHPANNLLVPVPSSPGPPPSTPIEELNGERIYPATGSKIQEDEASKVDIHRGPKNNITKWWKNCCGCRKKK